MRPTAFVVCLFVMAAACVVIAAADGSWGWLIGAAAFLAVGMLARGKLRKEREVGLAPARFGFVGVSMLVMLAAILFIIFI
ncbi:hypothetical protein [Longimicrobium terrae]|uniref:Uncharacterized protein n=1 Tax=Longimicrobium terrae TaxID=1639882 RepID=A0A841GUR9_9BACT|nr:hypothetical protein [Longimicrobium terrae]MBB4634287.1 hypothetical protein [Longimicrobium terrae]MBB6068823.1 hypothetical protein [Longimicrobium terrae]NNC28006.1 hypothetical protein [Longimicrobium terrae]